MIKFLINGQLEQQISLQDRGLHYGDGVFETIAIKKGNALCWSEHISRLKQGCERLQFPVPDEDLLFNEARLISADQKQAILKIIITRGQGGRGYQAPQQIDPSRILGLYSWPDYPSSYCQEGISCALSTVRLTRNSLLAGIKHLNRLEQVLARQEIGEKYQEAIMLDEQGNVIEGIMSNLFLMKDNKLVTPTLEYCGVEGVIRRIILEQANNWNLVTEIRSVSLQDIEQADELFFCNSIFGIWPVREFNGRNYSIGPVVRDITQKLIIAESIVHP